MVAPDHLVLHSLHDAEDGLEEDEDPHQVDPHGDEVAYGAMEVFGQVGVAHMLEGAHRHRRDNNGDPLELPEAQARQRSNVYQVKPFAKRYVTSLILVVCSRKSSRDLTPWPPSLRGKGEPATPWAATPRPSLRGKG